MCSGSEVGSYLRRTYFVYHSTLGLKVIKKRQKISFVRRVNFTASQLCFEEVNPHSNCPLENMKETNGLSAFIS